MSEIAKIIETQRYRCSRFFVVFFHYVFVADCDMCVCVCEAYWFLPKDKWNPIEMFNLHILHKKCKGKSIKNNNNNNNDKLVIKSLQTFFAASENEFLVLFIFSKIKCAFILSPRQISCQKGGLVYFANNFQIPLRNRNSSLECDMRYCCSTQRERERALIVLAFARANQQTHILFVVFANFPAKRPQWT